MKYVIFTTKGLESVAAEEIVKICSGAKIITIADKRVIFQIPVPFSVIPALSMADDIGIYCGDISNLQDKMQISDYVHDYAFDKEREYLRKFRSLSDSFSLTVSSAGSTIDGKYLKAAIKSLIQEQYGWGYREMDHTNFDIRIFIDHNTVLFAIRLTAQSIHHRTYKIASRPGSLKPTVAAAMVYLATEGKNNLHIVDNFCGSGTILCEAMIKGNTVFGGDIDPESVGVARNNIHTITAGIAEMHILDATKTGWKDASFDCAISNLPWDKQIQVRSITELFEGSIREYARILKLDGRLCVLVTKPELLVKYAKKYFPGKEITQIKIGLLGQNPTIILVK